MLVLVPDGHTDEGEALAAIWTRSSPTSWSTASLLPLGAGARLVASGAMGSEVFAVVQMSSSLGLGLVRPGIGWQHRADLPAGTAGVGVGAGTTDALTVDSTLFSDWRYDATTSSWQKLQTVHVHVPFGSLS